jgi:DNA-binding Lrp family transcriptional regulator
MSDIDYLKVYLAVGGIPYYHEMMDRNTFKECIMKNFIISPAPLIDEAQAMIDRELSPPSVHAAIISFLAKGTNRVKELAEKVGISQQLCGKHLKQMEAVGIIEKIHPMAGAPKHPLFKLRDNLMCFYYGAIEKRISLLTGNNAEAAYGKIEHDIDSCLGHIFEDVCAEHIKRTTLCVEIGKWWGRAGKEDRDVDIIAVIEENGNEISLFCECKFRRKPAGLSVLGDLKDTADYIKALSNRKFVIFSAFGFDEDLEDYAMQYEKTAGINLIGLCELLGESKK